MVVPEGRGPWDDILCESALNSDRCSFEPSPSAFSRVRFRSFWARRAARMEPRPTAKPALVALASKTAALRAPLTRVLPTPSTSHERARAPAALEKRVSSPVYPPRHGVLLQIAYLGTYFKGWASQKEGRTVQSEIRGAVLAVDPRASAPRGASRTDAGVHAEGQIATFNATLDIPPRGWVLALNEHLPDDVCVRRAWRVPVETSPVRIVVGKRYVYRILLDRVRDPLWKDRAWRIGWPIDLAKLAREASHLVGTHDFKAFRSSHDARTDTVRTITRVSLVHGREGGPDPRIVAILVEGNGFLYNMVRISVGTLMDVARGKLEEGAVVRALFSQDRKTLGTTAPAHGLTLERVEFQLPEEAGAPWPL